MDNRISREDLNLSIAALIAKRGTCQRLQVGAVITLNNRIISTGYNGPPVGLPDCKGVCNIEEPCGRAIHAEANAIAHAARCGIALEGATLWVTASPCKTCAELIIQSGIRQVVFSTIFRDRSGITLLMQADIKIIQHAIGV